MPSTVKVSLDITSYKQAIIFPSSNTHFSPRSKCKLVLWTCNFPRKENHDSSCFVRSLNWLFLGFVTSNIGCYKIALFLGGVPGDVIWLILRPWPWNGSHVGYILCCLLKEAPHGTVRVHPRGNDALLCVPWLWRRLHRFSLFLLLETSSSRAGIDWDQKLNNKNVRKGARWELVGGIFLHLECWPRSFETAYGSY
jgi:hypothetical protein